MLFRAVFWIAVVALFVPEASGSGLGSGTPARNGGPEAVTAAAGGFREFVFERLAAVKADIKTAERIRVRAGR
ncbi:MAG TPA: hypothetical protein VHT03_00285 [Rhizomicrobium sp.]|jgi:hypothetical protein|nr:hypothetical protein [Rhizomicrobium sp.]